MEHTPTPWRANNFRQDNIDHPACAVWTEDGENFICSTRAPEGAKKGAPSTRQAHINAIHIARCVNSHDALVAALEWALSQIDDDLDLDTQAALEHARAALRQAKGE
jgi:hypothetical protein